ncbi:MAG: alpha,alpha-trehalose-phosphate synthase (UDP-forming) [Actinomycetota bacterium]
MASKAPIVVASNRGPVTFAREADGSLAQRRGVGGLVTAVGSALRGREAAWVAAAITPGDRQVAAEGPLTLEVGDTVVRLRLATLEQPLYDAYYNDFSNRVLWFLHHYLWETTQEPTLGDEAAEAWAAYRTVNERFAALIAEDAPRGATALPQDYHLSLVPVMLRARRPDLRIGTFWHIPFCQPDQFRLLPDAWGTALLEGMLAADVIGFQTERWATNFVACCRDVLAARVKGRVVSAGEHAARVGIYPVGVDVDLLRRQASEPEVADAARRIDEMVGDRILLLRVDRTELSKNILRGFVAYERLLERRPDLHGRVVHLALLTPSRRGVPEYQEYMRACNARAERINERFSTPDWQPLILDESDDFPATLAAYRRYDLLIVNPVFDGMNLVAREGPTLNERDGLLILSRNAGAAAELTPALLVNPFDSDGTADALEWALGMGATERRERASKLAALAPGMAPGKWLGAQIRDVTRRPGS